MEPLDHPDYGKVAPPGGWIGGIDDKVRSALQRSLTREVKQIAFEFPVYSAPKWDPDNPFDGGLGSVSTETWKITLIRRRDNWREVTQYWKVAFGPMGQQVAGEMWEEG